MPTAWDDDTVTGAQTVTYGELGARMAAIATGLARAGLKPGDRVVIMIPIRVELYALALALLARGLVVVLVDGGMGTRRIVQAIRDARAAAIVTVEAVLKYRWVIPALWRLRRFCLDGDGLGLRPWSALEPADAPEGSIEVVPRDPTDHGLITFTSGSTGRPKGADRTHGLLIAQHEALRHHFPDTADDVDMPCFPVVTLHNLCCGIPTVMPAVDLRAPATVQPGPVLDQVRRHGVTRMSGAPAYVRRLVDRLAEIGETLPTVRHLLVGGAPVDRALCRDVTAALPDAACDVVYGSTEAEPIASIAMADILTAEGEGHLVGPAVDVTELALVALPDPPPARLDPRGVDPYRVPAGASGEVIVRGDHVNRGYVDNPEADAANKLFGPDDTVWHRTGDVGHLDGEGRLWLTGRTADLVHVGERVVHPLPLEAAIDRLDPVARCALVALDGGGGPVLAVAPAAPDAVAAATELLAARGLDRVAVHPVAAIPVDRRHNSKIDRPTLRRELARRS